MISKKVFLLALILLCLPLSMVRAEYPIPVFQQIVFEVRYIDPNITKNPLPKSPVQYPYIGIDNYTIYFFTPCDSCTLRVVNEDGEVEYSTVIPTDCESLELPSTLEGEYEIQIIRDNYCFYGMINL